MAKEYESGLGVSPIFDVAPVLPGVHPPETRGIEGRDCMVQAVLAATDRWESLRRLRAVRLIQLDLDTEENLVDEEQRNLSELFELLGESSEVTYARVEEIDEITKLVEDPLVDVFVGLRHGPDGMPHMAYLNSRSPHGFMSVQERTSDESLMRELSRRGRIDVFLRRRQRTS